MIVWFNCYMVKLLNCRIAKLLNGLIVTWLYDAQSQSLIPESLNP
jgi:hypothetical protein